MRLGRFLPMAGIAIGLSLPGCAAEPPIHLVLISVDTLRTDRLGSYGSTLDLTPALGEFARRCTRFDAAYAAAPFTLPSVAALMTSRHPEELGVVGNLARVRARETTLAERLQQSGWRSGAVVSNYVLRKASGLDQGFDHYDARFPQKEKARRASERVASATTDAALDMLERLTEPPEQPFFLWVHYQDPHGPYTPPPELRDLYLERERGQPGGMRKLLVAPDWSGAGKIPKYQFIAPHHDVAFYRAAYDGEVRFMDRELGRLLEALGESGVADRGVIVFIADHGEGMGEHDYWFAHGEQLTNPSVRIPFFLCVPGRGAGTRRDTVSILDVAPTVLSLLGVGGLSDARGRDLLVPDAEWQPSAAYFATWSAATPVPRQAMVEGGYKYARRSGSLGQDEVLYRLPDETTNLVRELPEVAQARRESLDRWRASVSPAATEEQRLSPEDRAALEALGYGQ